MTIQPKTHRETANRGRCFVAAPMGADFHLVQEVVEREGWEVFLITDVPPRTASYEALARQAISRADLVVGLLAGGSRDQVVLFELGIASALEKPTIITAVPGVDVPEPLRSFPLVWLAPGAGETLELAVRRAAADTRQVAFVPHEERPLGAKADRILRDLEDVDGELALVAILREALEAAGETVIQEGRAGNGIFDLGVWSPELELSVGNPLLIEVKGRLHTPVMLGGAIDQALHYTAAVSGRWAMVVYGAGPPASKWPPDFLRQPVLVSRADELVAAMRDDSFPEVVRKLRSARAHALQIA